jgi:hypothetical protein
LVKQASYGTEDERKKRWCGPCGGSHGAICLIKHTVERVKDARKAARKGGNEVEVEVEPPLSKIIANKVKPPPPVEPPLSKKAAKVTTASTRKVKKKQAANTRHLGGAHIVKKAIAKKKR